MWLFQLRQLSMLTPKYLKLRELPIKYNLLITSPSQIRLPFPGHNRPFAANPLGHPKQGDFIKDKFEFSLFWMSQWTACPPACTM